MTPTSPLASPGTLRPMLALALPVLAEQLLGVMVGYVDMILTGHLLHTDAHIAAMGSLAYLLWLLNSLFAAAAIGATAVVARLVGEGKLPLAAHASNQSLLVGIVSSVPITLLYMFGGETLSRWLQLDAVAAELSGRYLLIISLSVPLIAVQRVGIAALRGAGDTISGMVAMVVVNVLNLVIGIVLVSGWGPIPKLGWDGLAIGTAVGNVAGGILILAYLLAGRAGLPLTLRALRPDMPMIRRVLRIGIPGGVDTMAILFCHLWYLSIINAVSTLDAAAHGLGVRIESLAYLPGTAFQVAAATIAGQALGAADPHRARHGVWMATLVGGGIMSAAGFLFAFTPNIFALLFLGTTTSDVARLTIDLLQIVAVSMPGLAVVMILSGALRGAGDTRVPLLITFAGYMLVRIPVAYFLAWEEIPLPLVDITIPAMGWGAAGAWVAMVADTFIRASLMLWRFTHGGWTRVEV